MNSLLGRKTSKQIEIFGFIVIAVGVVIFFRPIHSDLRGLLDLLNIHPLLVKGIALGGAIFLGLSFRRLKVWARNYLLVYFLFCVDLIFFPILFYGLLEENWDSLAFMIIFLSSFLFLYSPAIKKAFPRRQFHSVLCAVLCLILGCKALFLSLAYPMILYKIGAIGAEIPALENKEIVYPSIKSSSADIIFPIPFAINVPALDKMRLLRIWKTKDVNYSFIKYLYQGSSIITPLSKLTQSKSSEKEYSFEGSNYFFLKKSCEGSSVGIFFFEWFQPKLIKEKIFFNESDLLFFKRTVTERFGIIFLILRSFGLGVPTDSKINRIDKVKIVELTAFIAEWPYKKRNSEVLEALEAWFFKKDNYLGQMRVVGPDKRTVRSVLQTIKQSKTMLNQDKNFFQKGLVQLKEKKYESAKLYFAYEAINDWENPDYHFYLGKTFLAQGLWEEAKASFQQVQKINPKYSQVSELINESETKEKIKEQPCFKKENDGSV